MSLSKYVLSGKMNYPSLTDNLPAIEYAKAKVHLWLYMLNDNQQPIKWFAENRHGTNVTFRRIQSEADYEIGLVYLKKYMNEVNTELGLDLKLN